MEKKEFYELLNDPERVGQRHESALQLICKNHPYLQASFLLYAKLHADKPEFLQQAAIRTLNRGQLRRVMQGEFNPKKDLNTLQTDAFNAFEALREKAVVPPTLPENEKQPSPDPAPIAEEAKAPTQTEDEKPHYLREDYEIEDEFKKYEADTEGEKPSEDYISPAERAQAFLNTPEPKSQPEEKKDTFHRNLFSDSTEEKEIEDTDLFADEDGDGIPDFLERLDNESFDQKEIRKFDEDDDEQPEVQAETAPRELILDDLLEDDEDDAEKPNFAERVEFERDDQEEMLLEDEFEGFQTPETKAASSVIEKLEEVEDLLFADEDGDGIPDFLERLDNESFDQKEIRKFDEDDDEQPEVQAETAPRELILDDLLEDDEDDAEKPNFAERVEFERDDQEEMLLEDEFEGFQTPEAKTENAENETSFFENVEEIDLLADEDGDGIPDFLERLDNESFDQKEIRKFDEDDDEQPEVQAETAPRELILDDLLEDDEDDAEKPNFAERVEFERDDQEEMLLEDEFEGFQTPEAKAASAVIEKLEEVEDLLFADEDGDGIPDFLERLDNESFDQKEIRKFDEDDDEQPEVQAETAPRELILDDLLEDDEDDAEKPNFAERVEFERDDQEEMLLEDEFEGFQTPEAKTESAENETSFFENLEETDLFADEDGDGIPDFLERLDNESFDQKEIRKFDEDDDEQPEVQAETAPRELILDDLLEDDEDDAEKPNFAERVEFERDDQEEMLLEDEFEGFQTPEAKTESAENETSFFENVEETDLFADEDGDGIPDFLERLDNESFDQKEIRKFDKDDDEQPEVQAETAPRELVMDDLLEDDEDDAEKPNFAERVEFERDDQEEMLLEDEFEGFQTPEAKAASAVIEKLEEVEDLLFADEDGDGIPDFLERLDNESFDQKEIRKFDEDDDEQPEVQAETAPRELVMDDLLEDDEDDAEKPNFAERVEFERDDQEEMLLEDEFEGFQTPEAKTESAENETSFFENLEETDLFADEDGDGIPDFLERLDNESFDQKEIRKFDEDDDEQPEVQAETAPRELILDDLLEDDEDDAEKPNFAERVEFERDDQEEMLLEDEFEGFQTPEAKAEGAEDTLKNLGFAELNIFTPKKEEEEEKTPPPPKKEDGDNKGSFFDTL